VKLAAAALAALALAVPATGAPAAGEIAFEVLGRVHVVAADGSGGRVLSLGGDASWPAWSRDGRRIAFTSVERRGIFVANADGSGLRRVTRTGTLDVQPAWSPDGRRLAFARFIVGWRTEIYVVGVDGRGLRRLTRSRGQDLEPDWAPNGRRIAWALTDTSKRFAQPAIGTMSPDGSAQRLVGPGSSPDWSPDGRRFAYTVNGEIFTCEASGGRGRVEVTFTLDAQESRPDWSPDGTRIAFDSTEGDPRERPRVFTVAATGGERTLLSPLVPAGAPTWRSRLDVSLARHRTPPRPGPERPRRGANSHRSL
jgi:Tol biopolymer transport system component